MQRYLRQYLRSSVWSYIARRLRRVKRLESATSRVQHAWRNYQAYDMWIRAVSLKQNAAKIAKIALNAAVVANTASVFANGKVLGTFASSVIFSLSILCAQRSFFFLVRFSAFFIFH